MPSNPDSQINFRDTDLAEHLDSYEGRDHRHKNAKQMLRRYQWLMEETLKTVAMQPAAAIALYAELNGCHTRHVDELPILQQSIANALRESGHEALSVSVRSLLPCQWVAVVDACDRVGNGGYQIENLESELKRVGLIL